MRVKVFLFVLLGLLYASVPYAVASLSGVAEWTYADYRAKAGAEETDASQFTQLYSLLYQKRGYLNGGRGGRYDLGLGMQWSSLDTSINDRDYEADEFKLLYRGDVLLAPGGLPFSLHLYSQDMLAPTWSFGGAAEGEGILNPNIVTDMRSGQHYQTGATLMVGIRNGSYLGQYREALSQFPRLLVDYREDYVRDMDNETPQHYRTRNLAFVSLNKKDNWFHYRLFEYTDFEDESENYEEKTYMLGTVDHTLTRQWINFTNWLRVSTDGSYVVSNRTSLEDVPERSYTYNLFAVAARSGWRASAFPTFNRTMDGESLEKTLEIPIYFQREVDADTAFRLRLIGAREREDSFVGDEREDEGDLYFSAMGDMYRTRSHIFSPRLEAEIKTGNQGKGYGASTGFEYYTNRAYRPAVDWFVSYSLTRLDGISVDDFDVDYWENQLLGRMEGSPSTSWRTGIEQRLLFGSGTSDRSVTRNIFTVGDTGLVASRGELTNRRGDTFRSTTTWFGEHRASRRLSNRFGLVYDYLSTNTGASDQVILRHNLRYDRRTFLAKMRNELTFGDGISSGGIASDELEYSGGIDSVDKTFVHTTSLRYSPGRVWEANATFDYYWQDGENGSTKQLVANQDYRYSIFRKTGTLSKIIELREEFEYEKYVAVNGDVRSMYGLTLAGDYYPSRRTLLGIRGRYRTYQPEDFDEYVYTLTAGLNYSRFLVSLDYSYGIRAETSESAKSNEHLWSVKVRKTF